MATKKPTRSRSAAAATAAKSKPQSVTKGRLQNLAARPSTTTAFGDDALDDAMLADNSGVFRVTSAVRQAQIGHEEDDDRFASDSLVMAAQRDNFRQRGPALDDVTEDVANDDDAAAALKRERLRTLAQRDIARRSTPTRTRR